MIKSVEDTNHNTGELPKFTKSTDRVCPLFALTFIYD